MKIISDEKLSEIAKDAFMEYWCGDDSSWDESAQCLWEAITYQTIVAALPHVSEAENDRT